MQKGSSRSIQLSRKYDMSQLKEGQIKDEKKLAVMPKIETPINNVMIKPQIVSTSSDTFDNITDTVSTVSTLSVPSLKMEPERTFANMENRKNTVVASHHLHPAISEYEINVLHYDDDILSGNKSPDFAASYLNFADANWHLVRDTNLAKIEDIEDKIEDVNDNMLENYQKRNTNKPIRDTKYSWKAFDGCMPSPRRSEHNNAQQSLEVYGGKPYECRIKYSWQVIGTSTQTSYSLLQDLLNDINTEGHESQYKMCSVKYSWQIIGTSTQASLHDCNDSDYWSGVLLKPNKNCNKSGSQIGDNKRDAKLSPRKHAKYPEGRLKRCLILNNQQTQTFAEKDVQADVNDYYYAKYSWHDLIKRCL